MYAYDTTAFFTSAIDDADALALFERAPESKALTVDWFYIDAYALSGATSALSIKFSSPVLELDTEAFTVPNGILTALRPELGGLVWHAEFSPAPGVFAKDNAIMLDTTRLQDVHGQRGAQPVESNRYVVDTLVMAYLDPVIEVTALATDIHTLSGHYEGSLRRGERILLMINDVVVRPDQIHIDPIRRIWRHTGQFDAGTQRVSATIIDGAHYFSKPAETEFVVDGGVDADRAQVAAVAGYAALLELLSNVAGVDRRRAPGATGGAGSQSSAAGPSADRRTQFGAPAA